MRRYAAFLVVLALLFAACGGATDDTGATTTVADATASDASTTTVEDTAVTDASTTTEAEGTETTSSTTAETPTTTEAPTGSGTPLSDSPLVAALAKAGEFTSARLEGWITIVGAEGQPAGTEATMNFSGAYDTTVPSSMMLMDMSDFAAGMPGSDELPPEIADLIGEMEIRTIGDTAYMRFGLFSMFGIPTEWVSMDADEAGDTASGFGANTADPAGMLEVFAVANADVDEIGREQVRGVDTTHYRIIADVEAMLAVADPESAAELRGTNGFPQDGSLPIDIWIGDDGFVHRFSYTTDGTAAPESEFESMELIWEIYDYGVPVDITAPPASEITDGSALVNLATG